MLCLKQTVAMDTNECRKIKRDRNMQQYNNFVHYIIKKIMNKSKLC